MNHEKIFTSRNTNQDHKVAGRIDDHFKSTENTTAEVENQRKILEGIESRKKA